MAASLHGTELTLREPTSCPCCTCTKSQLIRTGPTTCWSVLPRSSKMFGHIINTANNYDGEHLFWLPVKCLQRTELWSEIPDSSSVMVFARRRPLPPVPDNQAAPNISLGHAVALGPQYRANFLCPPRQLVLGSQLDCSQTTTSQSLVKKRTWIVSCSNLNPDGRTRALVRRGGGVPTELTTCRRSSRIPQNCCDCTTHGPARRSSMMGGSPRAE